MSLAFRCDGSGGTNSGETDGLNYNLFMRLTTRADTTDFTDVPVTDSASDEVSITWTTTPGKPGSADWPFSQSSYNFLYNVTAIDSGVTLRFQWWRVSGADDPVFIEDLGTSTPITSTGIGQIVFTGVDPDPGSASDRAQIRVLASSTGASLKYSLEAGAAESGGHTLFGPWPDPPLIPLQLGSVMTMPGVVRPSRVIVIPSGAG